MLIVMKEYLEPFFPYVTINIEKCPDLRRYPFFLRGKGLCDDVEVVEFGNEFQFLRDFKKAVPWKFSDLTNLYTRRTAFVIGGGGMFRELPNKEVVRNFTFSKEKGIDHESNYIYLNEEEQIATACLRNSYRTPFYNTPICDAYGNFHVCNGEQKKIIKLFATGPYKNLHTRISDMIQNALCYKYPNDYVGLSGLLVIDNGTVETTVLKRTFPISFKNVEELYKWDNYNNLSVMPLVTHNIIFNFENIHWIDTRKMKLTSCKNTNLTNYILSTNQRFGSTFVRNVSPCIFRGYFTVVSKLHRIEAQ